MKSEPSRSGLRVGDICSNGQSFKFSSGMASAGESERMPCFVRVLRAHMWDIEGLLNSDLYNGPLSSRLAPS